MLYEKLKEDTKNAMRAKAETELSVLRMLNSAISYKKIALNKGTDPNPLSDEEIIEVIASEIKKRKDSIESYQAGNRADLAEKEQAELKILARYLPAQLPEAEIEAVVRAVVAAAGEVTAKDFGRIMGQAMSRLKGQADGNAVTAIVKKVLGS